MIGDSLRGSEVHLMWENIGTFVDMSAEKASEQTTNIILFQRFCCQRLFEAAKRFKGTSRSPLSQGRSGSGLNVAGALARTFVTPDRPIDRPTD